MNQRQIRKLGHGIYLLKWKSGGDSLASVGSDYTGRRWFAPTNWIAGIPCFDWWMVKDVEPMLRLQREKRPLDKAQRGGV